MTVALNRRPAEFQAFIQYSFTAETIRASHRAAEVVADAFARVSEAQIFV